MFCVRKAVREVREVYKSKKSISQKSLSVKEVGKVEKVW